MWWPWKKKPESLDLAPYQGKWVAILHGKVITSNATIRDLMDVVTSMGWRSRGCTIFRVECPENVMLWSVQSEARPGWVYPNCLFKTREEAEQWCASWPSLGGVPAAHAIWTRGGQFDPWRPVGDLPEKSVLTES